MNESVIADWRLAQTLVALLQTRSLTGAARQLGLSQPTVGRHLDALEEHLGVQLFSRSPQGLVPTASALDLAEPASQMASSWAAMERLAAGRAESVAGTVRLTASRVMSNFVMPGVLATLRARHPDIVIELVSTDVVQDLLRRDADIAVRMMRPTQNDVVARKVNDLAIGVFASADYLRRRGAPRTVDELARHDLVGLDRSEELIRGFAEHGIVVDKSAFAFRCDDHTALVHAVAAGLGLGFIAHVAAAAVGLVEVRLPMPPLSLPIWLATHQEVHTSRRIRLVTDVLAEVLASLPLSSSSSSSSSLPTAEPVR